MSTKLPGCLLWFPVADHRNNLYCQLCDGKFPGRYLDEITQATLLIIGGVHKNPGPITREKDQLQIITQNVRGMIEVKKKKLIINTSAVTAVQWFC